MQRKFKNIYFYPNGEDTQAALVILKNLQKKLGLEQNFLILDDAKVESSLVENKEKILQNGVLWIIHQDKNIYEILEKKAKILPREFVFNGIEEIDRILLECLKKVEFSEIKKNIKNETFLFLNLTSYFVLQFYLTLKEKSLLLQELEDLSKKISAYFRDLFKIPPKCIGVAVTTFANNKHLGNIAKKLEEKGAKVIYVYGSQESYEKIPQAQKHKCILLPLQMSYMGNFFTIFEVFITCLMPLTSPSWGNRIIYVPHAFIDPIAALIQRKRPLDDFWFQRKMGINGYRIISSLSNYRIYQDKFKEYGFEEELVCGGYPSLDANIFEYDKLKEQSGISILIAINHYESLKIIKDFLLEYQSFHARQKVYFRPHPIGNILRKESDEIAKEYAKFPWFIYDTTSKLEAQIMRECCCVIGDYSSLVYTFPLTTLKPAILLCQDKSILENNYLGIKFYNSILHKSAFSGKECLKKVQEILTEDREVRANQIREYREKEVFNLGNSSEFIANFVLEKILEG